MTGLVNLIVWTLYQEEVASFGYVFLYMYCVALIVVFFKAIKFRIKI